MKITNPFYKANIGGSYVTRPMKNIDTIIAGILDILDGLVRVLTLGFFGSSLSLSYIEQRMIKILEKEVQKGNKNG